MAYEKTTWEDGVTMVSADRLNHIESGIETADTSADSALLRCRKIERNIIGADAYSSNVNYSVGDMCIYSNTAWKCLVACQDETPEEGTYWSQVSLKSLTRDLYEYTYTLNQSPIDCIKMFAWGPYIEYIMPLGTKQVAHEITEIRLYLPDYGWWYTNILNTEVLSDHKFRIYLTDTQGVIPQGLSATTVTGTITFT